MIGTNEFSIFFSNFKEISKNQFLFIYLLGKTNILHNFKECVE